MVINLQVSKKPGFHFLRSYLQIDTHGLWIDFCSNICFKQLKVSDREESCEWTSSLKVKTKFDF